MLERVIGQEQGDRQGHHLIHSSLWLPFLLRLQNMPMNTSGHIIKAKLQDRTKNWRYIVPVQIYSVITMDFAVIGGDNILVLGRRPKAIALERRDYPDGVCRNGGAYYTLCG